MRKKLALVIFGAVFLFFSIYFIFFSNDFTLGLGSVIFLILSIPIFSLIIFKSNPLTNVVKKSKDTLLQGAHILPGTNIKEQETDLDKIANMTEKRLFLLQAMFPFDLFPNKIYIEQKQVIVIYSQFFWTTQDYHVLIEDILMPVVETGLFFATLKLELGTGGFMQNPPPIHFLKKSEALRAKRIIVGLLICHKEKIDLSKLSLEEILKKVEEIGRVKMN